MRFPLLLILAVLFTARPDRLSAQEFTPGTVVRIRQPDSSSGIGRIHGISAESLLVRSSVSEQLQPVLRTPVTRLEARRQVSRATRAWTWAKRGFVLGALAGAAICLADRENCATETRSGSTGEGLLGASLFFGGAGALYGAAGGALFPRHRWEPAPASSGGCDSPPSGAAAQEGGE